MWHFLSGFRHARSSASRRLSAVRAASAAAARFRQKPQRPSVAERPQKREEAADRREPHGPDHSKRLPISASLRSKLRHFGLGAPTAVQHQTFVAIFQGQDVLAVSPAGNAKILAFLVPLLQRMAKEAWPDSEPAVVLQPTRALAEKVYLLANRLREPGTRVALLYGGGGAQSLEAQRSAIRHGAHLVIGTPGRVRELVSEGVLQASRVRTLVVDEPEEMLSKAPGRDVRALLADPEAAASRQTLFFAGVSPPPWLREELQSLARRSLLQVDLLGSRPPLPEGFGHHTLEISGGMTKRARALAWLLAERLGPVEEAAAAGGVRRALVFAASRAEVALLGGHAALKQRVVALHSEMSPEEKAHALRLFQASDCMALIVTDLAGRGLELPCVPLVLHSSPPQTIEAYSHRISRASSSGGKEPPHAAARAESIIVHGSHHVHKLRGLEKELGLRFTPLSPPDDEELRKAAVSYITRELRMATAQYDVEAFMEDATKQVQIHGARLLAAALVLLERRRRAEEWVSPLSGRARYTPLLFMDPHLKNFKTRQSLVGAISRILRSSGGGDDSGRRRGDSQKDRVGRIELTERGWVADIFQEDAARLLEDEELRNKGIKVIPLSRLPPLIDSKEDVDNFAEGGRRRRRQPQQGLSLTQAREKRRMEFLYPEGRRQAFGEFRRAGQQAGGASQKVGIAA